MRVLVTGAAGFIGMHLCAALERKGHEVVGLDNLSGITYEKELKIARLQHLGLSMDEAMQQAFERGEAVCAQASGSVEASGDSAGAVGAGAASGAAGSFTFHLMDLKDSERLKALIATGDFAVVVNLAALAGVRLSTEIPELYVQSNVNGFFNLLEALKEVPAATRPRLVFASSSSVYGDCHRTPFSEDYTDIKPKSVYAATKLMDETLAYTYASLFGLRAIGLRFFTVYGPYGRPDMAPFIFLKAFLQDQEITLFNHGKSRRDFTYVGDIVEGTLKIIEAQDERATSYATETAPADASAAVPATVPFAVYNIGNGSPVQLFDFVHTLEQISGKKARLKLEGMPKGDVEQTYADVSKLERDYGYRPHTSLKDGLQAFYDWYCDFYGVEKGNPAQS